MSSAERAFETIRQISSAYAALRKRDATLPDLKLVAVHTKQINDPLDGESTWKRVEGYSKYGERNGGWVRHRSDCYATTPDQPPFEVGNKDAGPPLYGEWLEEDGASIHLRPDPRSPGRFVFWRYADRPDPSSLQPGEQAALRQEIFVLESGIPNPLPEGTTLPALRYYVYWGIEDADSGELRRLFYRFAGFEEHAADRIVRTGTGRDRKPRIRENVR